jgi:imidazolonepropionase-like amidohydrolase
MLRQQAMPPAEVLRSATFINAELMNQSGKIGVIAPGARADLLVMDGNPVDDLSAFLDEKNMLMVMKEGKPVLNRLQ